MSEVMPGMEHMFTAARAEGMWFFTSYQQIWFTPDELEAAQRDGKFRWGACNWRLRPPSEYLAEFKDAVNRAQNDYARAVKRVQDNCAK